MTAGNLFTLYTRTDCHLCGLAVEMLESTGIDWRPVDIDSDPELVRKYGTRVPVVAHPVSGRELFFPFDAERLLLFCRGER